MQTRRLGGETTHQGAAHIRRYEPQKGGKRCQRRHLRTHRHRKFWNWRHRCRHQQPRTATSHRHRRAYNVDDFHHQRLAILWQRRQIRHIASHQRPPHQGAWQKPCITRRKNWTRRCMDCLWPWRAPLGCTHRNYASRGLRAASGSASGNRERNRRREMRACWSSHH